MGDIWNPFDDKNPVYKRLAKETSIQSKRIRNTVVVVGLLAAGYIISKKQYSPFFGGPANQFGMVRRK
jgi:hypothetical protein